MALKVCLLNFSGSEGTPTLWSSYNMVRTILIIEYRIEILMIVDDDKFFMKFVP